jgi:hypothetical protein
MNPQLEEFLEKYTTAKGEHIGESTKKEYIKTFKKFKEEFKTDDFITLFTNRYKDVEKYLSVYKSNHYTSKLNGFCTYYKIACPEKPKYEAKVFDGEVIDTAAIRANLDDIGNLKAKVWLAIHTDSSFNSVRRDWANTMIREFCTEEELTTAPSLYTVETGEFSTESDNKMHRPRKFVLSQSTRDIISKYVRTMTNKKYLFETKSNTIEKRNDTFSKYLRNITREHVGIPLQTNSFRKGISTEDQQAIIKRGGTKEEQYEAAKKRGHSYPVEHSTYLGNLQAKHINVQQCSTQGTQTEETQTNESHVIREYIMKLALSGMTPDDIQKIIDIIKAN